MRPIFIIAALAALALFSGCGQGASAAPPAQTKAEVTDLAPVEAPKPNQALVTYLSGSVEVRNNLGRRDIDIGDTVTQDDVVIVGPASFCELQFGETAVVKLEADTEVALKTLVLTPGAGRVTLDMKAGSVLAKVQKLSGADRFNVRTSSAVCGVRGTEFGVREDPVTGTTVAVKTGRVTVLPAAMDPEAIRERTGISDQRVQAVLEQIQASAPVVEANKEVVVGRQAAEQAAIAASAIEAALARAARDSLIEAREVTEVTATVANATTLAVKTVEPPKEISPESTRKLASLEVMRFVSAPAVAKTIRIVVEVEPADARILLGGIQVGVGNYQGTFDEGEVLRFGIEREGHHEHSVDITATAERRYRFTLAPLPTSQAPLPRTEQPTAAAPEPPRAAVVVPPPSVAPPPAAAPPVVTPPAPVPVTIRAQPSSAEIYVNGTLVGRGAYSGRYDPGSRLSVRVAAPGYIEASATVSAPGNYEYRLQPKLIESRLAVSKQGLVGLPAVSGRTLIVADRSGLLYAATVDGRLLWTVDTGDRPNENSSPVAGEAVVHFAGAGKLTAVDLTTGRITGQVNLDPQASGIFGRRPLSVGDVVYLPTNNSVRVFDARNLSALSTISIPGGSQMSVLLHQNKLLIVNQAGSLLVIDPATSTVEVTVPTPAIQPIAQFPAVSGSRVYFAGRKGTVVGVDTLDQRILWQRELTLSRPITTDLSVIETGVYVVADGRLFGFDSAIGSNLFAPIDGVRTPLLLHEGRLYYGTGDRLEIADARNGRVIGTVPDTGRLTTKPVVIGDRILVGNEAGELLTVNPTNVLR